MDTERDIWHNFSVMAEGVSVTTYSQAADNEPVVEDETWFTWTELSEMRPDI